MPQAPQSVNFCAAARRHYEDALLLDQAGRFPNAGCLFGFFAECGLKALLVWHGRPTKPSGDLKSGDVLRKHIDKLLDPPAFQHLKVSLSGLSGRQGSQYLAMIPNISAYADWRIEYRYYVDSALPASLPAWKRAAHEVGMMLDRAKVDGLP